MICLLFLYLFLNTITEGDDAMHKKILRCAIYIRVSTSEQMIHGKSLDAQRHYLEQYAKEHGMIIVGIYADEGKTARKELKKRKAIRALLEDVKAGKIDVILFWRLDRWFRNMSDFYKVQDILDEYGVRWISASEPGINMETRDGRLQLNVVLSIGQNEVDTTSERIKFVNEASIRQGKVIFGDCNMPRGYKVGIVDGKKCMIKDPEQEEMVNAFYDYFEKHQTKQGTLRYMQRTYDPNFSYSMLRTMLSSEFYKGTYRGIPYCPAYVSEERWARLQEISCRNIKKASSGRIYYFSGMIRCPICGQILCGTGCKSVVNRRTGEKRDYCYYRCNRAMIDRICTNRHRLSQNLIECYLLDNLEHEYEQCRIRVNNIQKRKAENPVAVRTEKQIHKEMERLNYLFQKSRITRDYYSKEYDTLEREINALSHVIIEPEPDYSFIESLLKKNFREIYQALTEENKRTFWHNTIRQIHLKPDCTVDYVDFL